MRILPMALILGTALTAQAPFPHPPTRKGDVVDDYFGTKVADPYRWLEDDHSDETNAWVEAQNKVSFGYLASIPERRRIQDRLTRLWNFERFGTPFRAGQSARRTEIDVHPNGRLS